MHELQTCLLKTREFSTADLHRFGVLVADIHANWVARTGDSVFPKLHMLHHALEFAERWRVLSLVAESQIEASHAQFNLGFNDRHFNKARDMPERVRRCLVERILAAIQPLLPKS